MLFRYGLSNNFRVFAPNFILAGLLAGFLAGHRIVGLLRKLFVFWIFHVSATSFEEHDCKIKSVLLNVTGWSTNHNFFGKFPLKYFLVNR